MTRPPKLDPAGAKWTNTLATYEPSMARYRPENNNIRAREPVDTTLCEQLECGKEMAF